MVQTVRVVTHEDEMAGYAALGNLVALGSVVLGLVWIWEKVTQWQSLEMPYRLFAAFYYYVVVIPVRSFGAVWNWLEQLNATGYPNLNLCISIFGIATYGFIFLITAVLMSIGANNVGFGPRKQFWLFSLPAFLALFWFLGSLLINWLLVK